MIKASGLALLLSALLMPAQGIAVEGRIRASLAIEDTAWVGQKIVLNLDLMTTGFSFSDQRIRIPEVPGAVLLQTDSSAIKLSEQADGETWQILRYELLLFTQRPGETTVPSISVSFLAAAGYGSEPTSFEFATEPLSVSSRLPPGFDGAAMLVVAPDFKLTAGWQPEPGQARVGDAFTLTVTRQARDIPSMAFTPLEFPLIDGLSRYPAEPVTQDRVDRGDLTAERTDSVTYVCERTGHYTIPQQIIAWWNPDSEQFEQERIPGLTLTVEPDPALETQSPPIVSQKNRWVVSNALWVLFAAIGLPGLTIAVRRFGLLRFSGRQQRAAFTPLSESGSFRELVMLSWSENPRTIYNALMLWLDRFFNFERPATIADFVRNYPDAELENELYSLQSALLHKRRSWSALRLVNVLSRVRGQAHRRTNRNAAESLKSLNPGRAAES